MVEARQGGSELDFAGAEQIVGRTPGGRLTIQTIEGGQALYSLDLLDADQVRWIALLFLAEGCDVSDVTKLAGSLAIDLPADRRSDLE